jgi:hypothetical protein
MRYLILVPLCLGAAACSSGEDSSAAKAATAIPASMAPGQYALEGQVTAFRSTDGRTPVVKAAVGDKSADAACVAAASPPPPEMFAGQGYTCTYKTTYIKDGMINAALGCRSKAIDGDVTMNVQGSYTAKDFDATVETSTYLPGAGDFAMTRRIKGRLTGPTCAPAEAQDGKAAAAVPPTKAG